MERITLGRMEERSSRVGLPGFLFHGTDILPFFCLNHLQGFNRNRLALGKTDGGFGRVSFWIEGSLLRRPDLLRLLISLFFRNRFDGEDEPSGGSEGPHPIEIDPVRLQFFTCQTLKIDQSLAEGTQPESPPSQSPIEALSYLVFNPLVVSPMPVEGAYCLIVISNHAAVISGQ